MVGMDALNIKLVEMKGHLFANHFMLPGLMLLASGRVLAINWHFIMGPRLFLYRNVTAL